jgi:hypothetical protein
MSELRLHKTNSIFRILCFFIILFFNPTAFSQTIPKTSISGNVVDASTGEPLHFANVFLNNTTLGCATDKNGGFSIDRIPLGTYSLVASMMGYDLEIRQIMLTESDIRIFEFNLHPKVVKGDSVIITAEYPHEWKRNLKKFQNLFLGTTSYAGKCCIENPEVLDFLYDKRSWTFRASAIDPLSIENRALGYRVKYILMDFEQRGRIHLNYKGLAYFEELKPVSEMEERKWRKTRIKVFKGSTRHFYAALFNGRLKEDGFHASNVSNIFNLGPGQLITVIYFKDFLSPGKFAFEKYLSFDRYLKVDWKTTTSWLYMRADSTMINASGLIYDPYDVETGGYWAGERLAVKLPWDFIPVLKDD